MAATAKKKYTGQQGTYRSENNRHSEPYLVFNATSIADAVGTAYTAASATITTDDGVTLYRGGASWEVMMLAPGEATGTYEVTIEYVGNSFKLSDVGTVRISADTTGGTQHVRQSLETIATYSAADISGTPPDFQGAIGVTSDSVDGTDVGVRVFHFTVSKVFAAGSLPSLTDITLATFTTNDANFTVTDSVTGLTLTLQTGELLFEGARIGDNRSDGNLEIVYSCSGSANAINLTVGTITGIDKKGWEYLWVRYGPGTDGLGDGKSLIQVPRYAVVDRVYEESDMSVLGI